MNKFEKSLVKDAKGIKEQRAKILGEETRIEHEEIVREILKRKRELEVKLLNLVDLSPENTYTLRPGGEKYDPKLWAREKQDIGIALLNIEVELEVANRTTKEWFSDVEE